jgi:hypothetical protein
MARLERLKLRRKLEWYSFCTLMLGTEITVIAAVIWLVCR